VGPLLGDQGEGLALASRAGRGRHGQQRQHRPGGPAGAPVVLHLPAAREQKVAALGGVDAAPAAQAHQEVDPLAARYSGAGVHDGGGRVLDDAIEHRHGHARALQQLDGASDVSRANDAGVGHDQDAAATLFGGDPAELIETAGAEDDPDRQARVEAGRGRVVHGAGGMGNRVSRNDESGTPAIRQRRAACGDFAACL
jgi:hypothetical protein